MGLAKRSNIKLKNVMFAIAVVVTIYFASPHLASAAQSSIYANFTKCPTGAPAMNDPSNEGAGCIAGAIRHGSIRLGNFGMPITSPLRFQFAVVGGGEELHVVPNSTSFEGQSFMIPNPFYVPPAQPAPLVAQAPPVKKKGRSGRSKCTRHNCKRQSCKRRGRRRHTCKAAGHKGSRKSRHSRKHRLELPVNSPPAVAASAAEAEGGAMIEVSVEAAGEVHNLELSAFAGEPGTAFELPLRLHLQGAGLGPACYIGSPSEPVVLAPKAISAPSSFQFGLDPNGFNVRTLGIGGINLEDASFSVPVASGCGSGSLDAPINALLGLPAAEGSSNALLADVLFEMVAAEYDGTPPDGGMELQAAFEAAQ